LKNFRDSQATLEDSSILYSSVALTNKGPQQQLTSLQVWLSASFSNRYWKTCKYFRFNTNIFDFAGNVFLITVSFGMGMTLYSCITLIAQMQGRIYL